ncbi:MAG: hypothetical protein KatS3mg105_0493 [Gemmatales bacterium]|nr:MAG: hypothetical protein KatS3mg105_0493 [Gemmatales bacterium]
MNKMLWSLVVAGLLGLASDSTFAGVLEKSVTGTPKVQSIDTIRFASEGVLLIGDGRGSQVFAVATGDVKPAGSWKANTKIEKIGTKLGARVGAKEIKIVSLAVNPASKRVYFAVQVGNQPAILTLDANGEIGELALEKVTYARIVLAKGEQAAISRITDLAVAEDRILVAAQANEQFGSKVYSIPLPLHHDASSPVFSTETYHVSHRRWETRAPMQALMPFRQDGKNYVVGSFACTPVVKYPLDDLQPGAKVKGSSVIELGSGNRPLRMISYKKGKKTYVLMNTFRFHHKKRPLGAQPLLDSAH